jgi:hypothetical protein
LAGGIPLVSRETVVYLIGNTKTKKGLKIKVKLDGYTLTGFSPNKPNNPNNRSSSDAFGP